jgi:tRNA-splicing ligase RtcB
MSRNAAKKRYTATDLADRMEGRVWNHRSAANLVDEIPDAYKPIEQVMADQADLVTIVTELRQILNHKGT